MLPWFKVDDQLHSHPKARRAGLDAMGLWLVAGSHCMSYLTDGYVEAWFVLTWPRGDELAAALVREELWLEVPGGWQFHDWAEFQPTREKVEAERGAAAERMRRVRANRNVNVQANDHGTNAARSPTPSPSPSPDLLLTESVSLGSNAREKSTDAEAIASSKKLASGLGLNLDRVIAEAKKLDRDLDHGEALRLGSFILSKARRGPKSPTAYVLGAFKRAPYEVQQWIDTEVLL